MVRRRASVFALIALLSGLLFARPSFAATTYYVDPSGVDAVGRGTSALPWRTLGYAVGQVAANQSNVIHLNAGTYTLSSTVNVPTGVTIEGAGRTLTTIKGGFNDSLLTFSSSPPTNGNQALRDLRLDGQSRAQASGVYVQGRHNFTLQRVDLVDFNETSFEINADGGARGYPGEDSNPPAVYVTGFTASDFTVSNSGTIHNNDWLSGAFQVGGVDGASIHGFTISNLTTPAYGMKFAHGGWFKNTHVYNGTITANPNINGTWQGMAASIEFWNVQEGNEINDLTVNTWMSFVDQTAEQESVRSLAVHDNVFNQPEACTPGITCSSRGVNSMELAISNADVYQNTFINPGNFGIAVWSGGGDTDLYPRKNNHIYKNVFYRNGTRNDHLMVHIQGSYIDGLTIDNNTAADMSGVFFQEDAAGTYVRNIAFRNNVLLNPREMLIFCCRSDSLFENVTYTNNVYQNLSNQEILQYAPLPTNFVQANNANTNPGLNLSGAKPAPYFEPSSTSSYVVDHGVNVGLPYNGSAPDIGRYEYGSGSNPTSVPTDTPTTTATPTATTSPTATPTPGAGTPLSRSGWIASAFASYSGRPASNAIDSDSASQWQSGQLQSASQWFQVDMLVPQTFNRVNVTSNAAGDGLRAYQLFVSNDGTNWGSAVASGTGGDAVSITFATQTARYIKLVQTGTATSNWWTISDLLVYPPTIITPTPTNTPTATPSPTPTGSVNVLTNGGMESGTTGWACCTLSSVTSPVHGGSKALRASGRTASWQGPGQTISGLVNGASYSTSIWLRSESGTPQARIMLQLSTSSGDTWVQLSPNTTINSSGWTQLSGTATISWSGTLTGASWYIETASGTDTLVADDASLIKN